MVGRWLKQAEDEAIHVLGLIEEAAKEEVADPISWIQGSINHMFNQRKKQNGKTGVMQSIQTIVDYTKANDIAVGGGAGATYVPVAIAKVTPTTQMFMWEL